MRISEFLEIMMLVSFGFSWPFNVIKSFKARTARGKSLLFLLLVIFGYLCGIVAKLTSPSGFKWYVLFFYVLNACMVMADLVLYFRNRGLDRAASNS